ncbi:hypothetical protein [Pelagicoccus sp. SDUM812002]|uniref:hypothetical protein n=1 Tax=Pelagicoccus sp. SDUM812002 TaxID=3041266 RepID=UPI00280F4AFB|nr:hypothetical protein [Pelagicoccus sp. SDUM812002]MDQ8187121.1 hypothetical protein [Pelagicoccus sp. SDUM812002]
MLTCQIHVYSLELKQPWSIASRLGQNQRGISERTCILLKLSDSLGNSGLGEAAPVSTYGETALSTLRFLREFDWTRLSFHKLENSLEYLHACLPETTLPRLASISPYTTGQQKLPAKTSSHS